MLEHNPHDFLSIYMGTQRTSVSISSLALAIIASAHKFFDKKNEERVKLIVRILGFVLFLYSIIFMIKQNIDSLRHIYNAKAYFSKGNSAKRNEEIYSQILTNWKHYVIFSYVYIVIISLLVIILMIS